MSTPGSAEVYTQGFGSKPTTGPINSTVNPGTTFNILWKVGQIWINTSSNTAYILTSIASSAGVTTPTWTLLESASGALNTLTGDTGTATPVANNVKISGTASEITTAASGSTVTLSIPSAFVAPGSVTATTTLTATLGNITATAGNFVSTAAGNGLVLNSGTASGTTTATLNGRSGQVTITTPSIAAGATFSFALTNSSVTASTTQVLYGLTGGTTGAAVTIQSVTNSASTSTIVLMNGSGATANTGSLVLTFLVLN